MMGDVDDDDDDEVLFADFIESRADSLAVREDEQLLRDNLRQLEEVCKLKKFKDFNHQEKEKNGDELMRRLWLHLIGIGVRTENIQLCLVLVAKLKLVQLALILKAALQQQQQPNSCATIALAYLSDYFHLDNNNRKGWRVGGKGEEEGQSEKGLCKSNTLLFAHEHLIDFSIDRGQWAAALDLIDRLILDTSKNSLSKQLLLFRRAQDSELDENFEEALEGYAQSGTERQNVPRLMIKQYMDLAYLKLRDYCCPPTINHANEFNQSAAATVPTSWRSNFWSNYAQLMSSARNRPIINAKNPQISKQISMGDQQQFDHVGNPPNWSGGCLDEFSQSLVDSLPKAMRDFINDPRPDKWTSGGKRKLDSSITMASGLTSGTRKALAELAIRYRQLNLLARACDFCLCLNHTETIVLLAPLERSKLIQNPISSVRLTLQLGLGANMMAINLIDYIDRCCRQRRLNQHQRNQRLALSGGTVTMGRGYMKNKSSSYTPEVDDDNENNYDGTSSTIFLAYIKLGLIDESLQVLSTDKAQSINDNYKEQAIYQAIDHLQNAIRISQTNGLYCLDKLDPEVGGTTLVRLQKSILNANQTTIAQILTVIILSIQIFLLKLHNNSGGGDIELRVVAAAASGGGGSQSRIQKLEIMFKRLAELYLNVLDFEASDSLVRATNNLVGTVKGRLDELADSDAIREGFRMLVETIAGKCMIEGRYKSAAALYSQIEDNVSAVKSLMRMGDIDIVLDYSLLVRDITVNRLTINYLKHLNVQPEVIDDFISRSKS